MSHCLPWKKKARQWQENQFECETIKDTKADGRTHRLLGRVLHEIKPILKADAKSTADAQHLVQRHEAVATDEYNVGIRVKAVERTVLLYTSKKPAHQRQMQLDQKAAPC